MAHFENIGAKATVTSSGEIIANRSATHTKRRIGPRNRKGVLIRILAEAPTANDLDSHRNPAWSR